MPQVYICNETHFRALKAVDYSIEHGGELRAAFFIHIPYAIGQQPMTDDPADEDFSSLALAVAGLISRLITMTTGPLPLMPAMQNASLSGGRTGSEPEHDK
jgi:hypothetical protein